MYWLRTIEAVASCSDTHIFEAELGSEARITGQLEYANGAILLRPLTYAPDGRGLFKYVLRLRLPIGESIGDRLQPTRRGYVFPGGPIGELVALCSLKLRARLFLLSITNRSVSQYDTPISKTEFAAPVERVEYSIDTVVFDHSARNFTTEIGPFLGVLTSVPDQYHLELAIAAERYAYALRMIGVDEELVFVSLVSAIERLASHQTIHDDPLSSLDVNALFQTDCLSSEQVDELKKLLETRKIKQRFISFIKQYSVGFFDGESRKPAHTQVTPENLREVLDAIYNARSGYLHNGDPMYLSSSRTTAPHWHMDASVGLQWQGRYFRQSKKLPRADFFHRLVRYCFLARLDELAAVTAG